MVLTNGLWFCLPVSDPILLRFSSSAWSEVMLTCHELVILFVLRPFPIRHYFLLPSLLFLQQFQNHSWLFFFSSSNVYNLASSVLKKSWLGKLPVIPQRPTVHVYSPGNTVYTTLKPSHSGTSSASCVTSRFTSYWEVVKKHRPLWHSGKIPKLAYLISKHTNLVLPRFRLKVSWRRWHSGNWQLWRPGL